MFSQVFLLSLVDFVHCFILHQKKSFPALHMAVIKMQNANYDIAQVLTCLHYGLI